MIHSPWIRPSGVPQHAVFRRLAPFPATFDLETAANIGAGDGPDVDAVEAVSRLVYRSLDEFDGSRRLSEQALREARTAGDPAPRS